MANLPYPVHDTGILPIPEPEGIIGASYSDAYPPSAPITSDNYTSSSPYSSQSNNIYSGAQYQDSASVSASNNTPYSTPNPGTPYSAPSNSAPYSQPYPSNNATYPSQPSQSYPTASMPYPNANAHYPGNNSPYPAVNQLYPPSNPPYSQPFSSTEAPYHQPYPQQTNMPPYPQGYHFQILHIIVGCSYVYFCF